MKTIREPPRDQWLLVHAYGPAAHASKRLQTAVCLLQATALTTQKAAARRAGSIELAKGPNAAERAPCLPSASLGQLSERTDRGLNVPFDRGLGA